MRGQTNKVQPPHASAHLKTCTNELNDIAIPAGAQQGNLLHSSTQTASGGPTSGRCREWPAADVQVADEFDLSTVTDTMLAAFASPRQVLVPVIELHDRGISSCHHSVTAALLPICTQAPASATPDPAMYQAAAE